MSTLGDAAFMCAPGEPHQWQRVTLVERQNGPHIFRCTWCQLFGWRKRFRKNAGAPLDPIRIYGNKRQAIMVEREQSPLKPSRISAKPMSGRRGMNGGYVPPGSSGGR